MIHAAPNPKTIGIIKNLINTKVILKKRPGKIITEDLFQCTTDEIDDFKGRFFENVLASLVNFHLSKNISKWRMFQSKPKFIGTSGHSGNNLKSNLVKSLIIDCFYFLKYKIISI